MIRCRQCNSELIVQARFCNVCGLPQNPQESEIKNAINPSQTVQQPNTSIPESSYKPQFVSTRSEQSNQKQMPEKAISDVQTMNVVAIDGEHISTNSIQTSEDFSMPTRTPGIIRPITPKSSRSVIPTRPDSNGKAISSLQSTLITRTPEYPVSKPSAKESSPINNQAPSNSSPKFVELTTKSKDKGQISELATEQMLSYSQLKVNGKGIHNRSQEQITTTQTPPVERIWQNSSLSDSDELATRSTISMQVHENNAILDTAKVDLLNPASFIVTSKAAEQWRKSWRDRQYAEAGPAENVSRGQASVPMPLTPMHQSLVRIRAIPKNVKKAPGKLGTWITIFLMICLIIGLGTYIIISYIPNSHFGVTSGASPISTTQPALVLVGTTSQTNTNGHTMQLHGEYFDANQIIIFLRDMATPIIDRSGNNISSYTDNKGTFNVTIAIDSTWSVGSHTIEALDRSSSQYAFQTIQIIPASTAITTSTQLSVSMQGKRASLLTFKSVIGQGNPNPQQITITNTSGSPLQWTATTSTNNNLNWLVINDNNNYGQLAISQTHSILISVDTVGLKTTDTTQPYKGQIIFTLNNTQLLTLPVQLQIVDATPEMVFSPNPIIAQIGPGNTCQPGVTLTLINLGTAAISWAVNPDLTDKIKFVSNGQLLESGTLLPSGDLLPSGQSGDTIVLTLQCTNIRPGQTYHVSVYANKLFWSELVVVQ